MVGYVVVSKMSSMGNPDASYVSIICLLHVSNDAYFGCSSGQAPVQCYESGNYSQMMESDAPGHRCSHFTAVQCSTHTAALHLPVG